MPSLTRPRWLVSSRIYGYELLVPTYIVSEPTPSRLVGKCRSVISKPTISILLRVISEREPIVVVWGWSLTLGEDRLGRRGRS
jgi:hypothetical protein